jgi:hypothetical protein
VTSGHSWWILLGFVVGPPRSRKSSETWGTPIIWGTQSPGAPLSPRHPAFTLLRAVDV